MPGPSWALVRTSGDSCLALWGSSDVGLDSCCHHSLPQVRSLLQSLLEFSENALFNTLLGWNCFWLYKHRCPVWILMNCEIGRCLKGNSINCEQGSVSTLNGLGKFIVRPVTEHQCDACPRISPEKPIKQRKKVEPQRCWLWGFPTTNESGPGGLGNQNGYSERPRRST